VITPSPRQRVGITKRSASGYESSANKRARYWLGDQAANVTNGAADDLEEDDSMWNNDVDIEDVDVSFDGDDFYDDYDDEADDESDEQSYKGPVRALSEDIAAQMDISD
jgi:hypothetical protein